MGILHSILSIIGSGEGDEPIAPVSYLKNVRITPFSEAATAEYHAFGTAIKTGADRLTLLFRRGVSELVDGDPSYAHLYRGRTYQAHYTPSTDTWAAPVQIDEEIGRDLADHHGGYQMDNGEFIYFSSVSPVAIAYIDDGEPWPAGNFSPFFRKAADESLAWGSRVTLTGYDTSFRSGTNFGMLQAGANPGEYYIGFNVFGYGSETARKLYCLKTTDYFATWNFIEIYSGSLPFSEMSVAYLGGGRLFSFARIDNGGYLYLFKSSDSGATWTAIGQHVDNNLGWYTGAPKIPTAVFMHNGLLNIMYHDRDNFCTMISKDNDPDDFFGMAIPVFNPPEIYWYNWNGEFSGNPSLGYPIVCHAGSDRFLVAIAKEVNTQDADLYYTMDDFLTDPDGVPAAPPTIADSFITATTFRLDINGYTDAQKQNIRYFQIDVSTDAGFGSFITASYNGTSVGTDHTSVTMQNVRMAAFWIGMAALTTGTTYYIRIRAVNNAGASSYTTKTVTTI